ncbi:hypothetical protein F2Q69_00006682 [Brassica cretica]|uniref:Uncharacterized protein n=1 Tax=Brassica cretica TaxID=69181 RepID=A0A8S9NVR7_BRACR|nr:hypothetical protein F2Q69_00006682 [Brassica cretica]
MTVGVATKMEILVTEAEEMEVIMKRIKFIKLRRMNMILKFDEAMKDGTFTIRGYVGGGEVCAFQKQRCSYSNFMYR